MNLEDALKISEICISAVVKNMKAKVYGEDNSGKTVELIEKDIEALAEISEFRKRYLETKQKFENARTDSPAKVEYGTDDKLFDSKTNQTFGRRFGGSQ